MTEDSAPLPVASAAGTDHIHPDDLRKEGWTMALYVAICLIAALTALANVTAVPGHILGLVWGTTVGLAVAHVFAFRMLVVSSMTATCPWPIALSRWSSWLLPPQSRVVVSVPVLLVPPVNEITWARYTCAAIIGVVGYLVARGAERSRIRSVLFGLGVLAAAFAVAALKHALSGH